MSKLPASTLPIKEEELAPPDDYEEHRDDFLMGTMEDMASSANSEYPSSEPFRDNGFASVHDF